MPLNPFYSFAQVHLVMSLSKKAINQLCRALTSRVQIQDGAVPASTTAKRRRRRRRRARAAAGIQNVPSGQPGMPSTTGPRRRPTRLVGGEGGLRVARDELFISLGVDDTGNVSGTYPINPFNSGTIQLFPWLEGIARSYERIVWNRLEFSWRSAVGTTSDGIICYGVNWESPGEKVIPTRADVTSLFPVKDHPVWQTTDNSPLLLPLNMLQSRKHYIMRSTDLDDACPGSLQVSIEGAPPGTKDKRKTIGELWVRYDVTLLGPRRVEAQ